MKSLFIIKRNYTIRAPKSTFWFRCSEKRSANLGNFLSWLRVYNYMLDRFINSVVYKVTYLHLIYYFIAISSPFDLLSLFQALRYSRDDVRRVSKRNARCFLNFADPTIAKPGTGYILFYTNPLSKIEIFIIYTKINSTQDSSSYHKG